MISFASNQIYIVRANFLSTQSFDTIVPVFNNSKRESNFKNSDNYIYIYIYIEKTFLFEYEKKLDNHVLEMERRRIISIEMSFFFLSYFERNRGSIYNSTYIDIKKTSKRR